MSRYASHRSAEFASWCESFKASAKGNLALKHLKELDGGDLSGFHALEKKVLEACFHAWRLMQEPSSDDFERQHQDVKSVKESSDDVVAAIKRIRRAVMAQPYYVAMFLNPIRSLMNVRLKAGEDTPDGIARTFVEMLDALENGFLATRSGDVRFEGRIAGCLMYPSDIRNQRSANYAENGLIFHLALIFKRWSTQSLEQLVPDCVMPNEGKPHYSIIVRFIHAALYPDQPEPPYDAAGCGDRLKKLLKNHAGVRYIGWGE